MYKKMETIYYELAEYFVFDPQKYTLDEFFTDIKTFRDSFNVIFNNALTKTIELANLFSFEIAMPQRQH